VWIILAGSALGLSAGTQGRLLGSALYALGEPKPPLRAALVRVAITGVLGWAFALPIRDAVGYSPTWGAFGLTASAGFAAWIEFLVLRRGLAARIGEVPLPIRLGFAALAAALAAGALAAQLGARSPIASLAKIAVFGAAYLAIISLAKIPEAAAFTRWLRRLRP
jgi:putative peptidoglycan lipid II flippase